MNSAVNCYFCVDVKGRWTVTGACGPYNLGGSATGIAQSLFVEISSLATQAHKQAVLTTIGLSQGVSELLDLLLEVLILNH